MPHPLIETVMPNRVYPLASFLLVLLVAACANPLIKHQQSLASSVTRALPEFPTAPLALGQTIKARLEPTTGAAEIAGEKSFVKIFRLPNSAAVASIHVIGDCDCGYADTAVWMLPNVTVLDAQYGILSTHLEYSMMNRVKTEYWSERLVAVGHFSLPPQAKYVAVHTSKAALSRGVGMSYARNQTALVGGTSVNTGANSYNYVIPASPVGPFEITLLARGETSPNGARFEAPPFGTIVEQ